MDFFGIVEVCRTHLVLLIVLASIWAFAASYVVSVFGWDLGEAVGRVIIITAGAGLFSWPAMLSTDVNWVCLTCASVAVIYAWTRSGGEIAWYFLRVTPFGRDIEKTARESCKEARRPKAGKQQGQGSDHEERGPQDGGGRAHPTAENTMTRQKALELLELTEDATRDLIAAAYKRLIMKNHPDQGGSTLIAKMLNEAKDVLLA